MEIHTIGGYSEVGKNMTVLETGEDAIVFDCGLHLPPIVQLQEREKFMNEGLLRQIGALPDDLSAQNIHLKNKVRAILISHAHLDHVGAVPYLAKRYNADVVGTPFTLQVLNTLIQDEKINFQNKLKKIQPNSKYIIKGKKEYEVEFINITHSTIQASMIAVHTDEGVVLYANDFKFDNSPQLGKKPNYEALRRIAKEGVKTLIVESLYAHDERKTPSEKIARGLLEDVMLGVSNENSGIIVTTFSSHIARLKSIVDMGLKLNRKIVFVGRSLNKYTKAAIDVDLCPFQKNIELSSYRKKTEQLLSRVNKNKKDYLVVCTGHQGEPGSILERISRSNLPYKLSPNDNVIFSSSVIPAEINIQNREAIENRLKNKKIRIFDKVHVSGHAAREDLRDFINLVSPEHIIPAHGGLEKLSNLAELAKEMGYTIGKNCHISKDLGKINI